MNVASFWLALAVAVFLAVFVILWTYLEPQGSGCCEELQLVGFSSKRLTGDSGVLTFTSACQEDFSQSRMCTTEEVMRTIRLPAAGPSKEVAWVRPTRVEGSKDVSGVTFATCTGWAVTTALFKGLSVDGRGRFSMTECSSALPVACCSVSAK